MKVLLTAAVLVFALTAAATSGAAAKPQKMALLEITSSFVGTGGLDSTFANPPKVGQGFVLTSDFYKWKGTKRGAHVGTLQLICVFAMINIERGGASEVCTGGILLPGGQIAVAGRIGQSENFDVPIVGGTGAYAGARGYVRVKDIGGENSNTSADTIVITG